jgi:hypothetical protein
MNQKSPLKFYTMKFIKFPFFLVALLFVGILSSQARYFEFGTSPSTIVISGLVDDPVFNGTFTMVDYGEDQIDADLYLLDGDSETMLALYADGSWTLGKDGNVPSGSETIPYSWYATGNVNEPGVNYTVLRHDGWQEVDGEWVYNDGITTWFSEDGGWVAAWEGGGFGPAYLGSGGTTLEDGTSGAFVEQATQLNVGLEFIGGQWTVKQ